MALILYGCKCLSGCQETFSHNFHVSIDIFLVSTNGFVLFLKNCVKLIHVATKIVGGGLKGFKRNHKFSLNLDSFLVVVLVPNGFLLFKCVDLLVKVSTWENFSTSVYRVIGFYVFRVAEIFFSFEISILMGMRVILGRSLRRSSGRSLRRSLFNFRVCLNTLHSDCECKRGDKFHKINFIFSLMQKTIIIAVYQFINEFNR